MSASWISRVRFEVMTTIGGCSALTVPSSGMVTWKSASTSSRNASNASSVRSSSSISSTGAPAGSGSSACSSGRLIRKRSENTSLWMRSLSCSPSASASADRDHLRGVVPLVDRGRDVEPLVALQADQPAAERRRPAPWRSRSCRRRPRLRGRSAGPSSAPGTARSQASGRRGSWPRRAASAWRRWRRERLSWRLVSSLATYSVRPGLSRPSRSCCHAAKTSMPGTRPGMTPLVLALYR